MQNFPFIIQKSPSRIVYLSEFIFPGSCLTPYRKRKIRKNAAPSTNEGAAFLLSFGYGAPLHPVLDGAAEGGEVAAGQQLEADGAEAGQPELKLAVQVGQAG